jgi:predicted phosphodiesterase
MRIGVLSDIHSNYEALDAVLEDAVSRVVDGWWLLGDAVGYGGDPDAVVNRLRSLRLLAMVRGNHDKVIAGIEEPEGFSPIARDAALHTRSLIREASRAFLRALPKGPVRVSAEVALCHGSWQDEDLYLLRREDIARVFDRMEASLLFFGHTHRAGLYVQCDATVGELLCEPGVAVELPRRGRYLVNPGSVGQPRDRDVRAAYAIFDTDSWSLTFARVPYDVEKAQLRILAAGLPEVHALRLAEGR